MFVPIIATQPSFSLFFCRFSSYYFHTSSSLHACVAHADFLLYLTFASIMIHAWEYKDNHASLWERLLRRVQLRQPSFQATGGISKTSPCHCLHFTWAFVFCQLASRSSWLSLQLDFCLIYRSLPNHQETFTDTLRPIYPLSNMNCQQVGYDDD